MNILALSGSLRAASVNTALLRALAGVAEPPVRVEVWEGLGTLPIFSPDLEGGGTPLPVMRLMAAVGAADAVVIACSEYARTIPGGLKNAIDWLVSCEELAMKPMALLHASARGDEMLGHLRRVLETVSSRFTAEVFLRVPLPPRAPEQAQEILATDMVRAGLQDFLLKLQDFVQSESA